VKLEVFVAILIALGIAYSVPLTNFDLLGRAQSTGTGLQKITISCIEDPSKIGFPEMINDISVLAQVGCKHINLEDIEKEKLIGHFIGEINRRDPNVATRSEIYRKSFGEIKKHPILGIGWGSIGRVFGLDERGAALNSSNIFLETWLGAGIIGVLAFLALWFFVVMRNIWNFTNARDNLSRSISLFFILSWFALTVSNLFNAGLFLGFLWLWLGAAFTEEKKGKA
jgi:O-antigen ligase